MVSIRKKKLSIYCQIKLELMSFSTFMSSLQLIRIYYFYLYLCELKLQNCDCKFNILVGFFLVYNYRHKYLYDK